MKEKKPDKKKGRKDGIDLSRDILDLKRKELFDFLTEQKVYEFEYRKGKTAVSFKTADALFPSTAAEREYMPGPEPAKDDSLPEELQGKYKIISPMNGTFYRSSAPGAKPYVEEGDEIKNDQVLCILEAMKLMNELKSEVSGKVLKILVKNAEPVSTGQPIFIIDKKYE